MCKLLSVLLFFSNLLTSMTPIGAVDWYSLLAILGCRKFWGWGQAPERNSLPFERHVCDKGKYWETWWLGGQGPRSASRPLASSWGRLPAYTIEKDEETQCAEDVADIMGAMLGAGGAMTVAEKSCCNPGHDEGSTWWGQLHHGRSCAFDHHSNLPMHHKESCIMKVRTSFCRCSNNPPKKISNN